jgi:hypothetical protein
MSIQRCGTDLRFKLFELGQFEERVFGLLGVFRLAVELPADQAANEAVRDRHVAGIVTGGRRRSPFLGRVTPGRAVAASWPAAKGLCLAGGPSASARLHHHRHSLWLDHRGERMEGPSSPRRAFAGEDADVNGAELETGGEGEAGRRQPPGRSTTGLRRSARHRKDRVEDAYARCEHHRGATGIAA